MTAARRGLSRRALLRGAGSIAIALPFLEEWLPRASAETANDLPCRLFTMSFGLGIELAMQLERFDGPLAPLAPFAAKTAMFTNVDGGPLQGSGTPHFKTSAATFTGVPQFGDGGSYRASGPSMEQVMKRALHPTGVPNVAVPELSAGLWSRTGAVSQYTRHWNADGSPGQRPERRPSRVFSTLFGNFDPTADDPDDPETLRRNHLHRSVLDTVMDQYRGLTSDRSPLGAASKARIANHLAAIRDVELQLAPPAGGGGPDPLACAAPSAGAFPDPGGYSFYDNASGATGAGAPAIQWTVARDAMALIGKLFALAASCDRLRFGSLVFVGGGGHVRFRGTYSALGQELDFTDRFGTGTPHDVIFHAYDEAAVRLYQHFSIAQLAHALTEMDAIVEPNGRTVLDNSVVLVGTEYGKNHDPANTFHAVVGGGDRFVSGWYDQALLPSDVYHQTLAAYGVDSGIPERWPEYSPTQISGFRAR